MDDPDSPLPPAGGRTDPWYAGGLRFECSRCGDCCRGRGYVWVSDAEIEQLATHLEISAEVFRRRFVRTVGERRALVDNAAGDCIQVLDVGLGAEGHGAEGLGFATLEDG